MTRLDQAVRQRQREIGRRPDEDPDLGHGPRNDGDDDDRERDAAQRNEDEGGALAERAVRSGPGNCQQGRDERHEPEIRPPQRPGDP